jgi:hypothetical protein
MTDKKDNQYKAWEAAVNRIIASRIMVDLHDMPDVISTRDLFDDGIDPKEAASEIMQQWADDGDMPEELL